MKILNYANAAVFNFITSTQIYSPDVKTDEKIENTHKQIGVLFFCINIFPLFSF